MGQREKRLIGSERRSLLIGTTVPLQKQANFPTVNGLGLLQQTKQTHLHKAIGRSTQQSRNFERIYT